MREKLGKYIKEYSVRNKANEDIPVYSVTNTQGFCQDYFGKEVASKDKSTYKIVPRGCFAYNPSRINVGSIDWQRNEDRVIVSPLYNVFSTSELLDQQYLYYFLKSDIALQMIRSAATGSVRDNLKFSMLCEFSTNIPALEMQKGIVRILDKVKTLIDFRQQELQKLDDLVKARFVEMFGDPVDNSKHFDLVPLGQLGVLKRGVSKHRPRNDAVLLGGNFPLIQTGDVSNAKDYITEYTSTYSEEGLKQSKMWGKGTLCITIAANIADTAILNFDACFPDSVVGFIPNEKVTTLFIHNWFKFLQPVLEENAPAVAQKNLNVATLEKTGVIVPPIEMQNEFEIFVQQIDKSKFVESIHVLKLIKEAIAKEVSHDRIR